MAQIASQGQGVLVYLRPPPLTAGARRPPVLGLRHDKRALTDFPVDAIVMAIIRDLGIPELVALDYPSIRCRSGLRQHLVDTDCTGWPAHQFTPACSTLRWHNPWGSSR